MTRVAVLGGHGKTGRALTGALPDARPLGRADLGDLPGALAGCDAAYLIAPNLHPDEPAYVADALAALHTAGIGRVVYHSVASPYAPAMPLDRSTTTVPWSGGVTTGEPGLLVPPRAVRQPFGTGGGDHHHILPRDRADCGVGDRCGDREHRALGQGRGRGGEGQVAHDEQVVEPEADTAGDRPGGNDLARRGVGGEQCIGAEAEVR